MLKRNNYTYGTTFLTFKNKQTKKKKNVFTTTGIEAYIKKRKITFVL